MNKQVCLPAVRPDVNRLSRSRNSAESADWIGVEICVSDRCFFPKAAFLSSKKIVSLAKGLGYEQVELHPTWSICWEVFTKGKLSCQAKDISSFHIDWRQDRRHEGLSFLKKAFYPASHLFPPTAVATKVLQKLENEYKKPVVIHWLENIKEFKSPILELHQYLTLGTNQVVQLLDLEKMNLPALTGAGSSFAREARKRKRLVSPSLRTEHYARKIKGVVIDTNKFFGWKKQNGLKEDEKSILKKLLPKIAEVHFRFKHKGDIAGLLRGEKCDSLSLMRQLINLGYKGRVVVEAGWPEAGSVADLWRVDVAAAKKFHRKIINFLLKV